MAVGLGRIVHVESAAGQGFVEIPGAPRRDARGRGPDNGLDLGLGHRLEDPLQDQEIDVFVAQRKSQVIGKGVAGPVALVEDGPGLLSPVAAAEYAVRRRNSAGGPAPEWRARARAPPSRPAWCRRGWCFPGRSLVGPISRRICRKPVTLGENHHFLSRCVEIQYSASRCRNPLFSVENSTKIHPIVENCRMRREIETFRPDTPGNAGAFCPLAAQAAYAKRMR